MELILLPDTTATTLEGHYRRALTKAVELYIVSAYLTEWNAPAELNEGCKTFRLIIGKDFGITRKQACRNVMKWLPGRVKNRFMVAAKIDGFHPKAMFWREANGTVHALIGSSNLTRAAFSKNHEANLYLRPRKAQFSQFRKWVDAIAQDCVAVSEDWLALYREAPAKGPSGAGKKTSTQEFMDTLKLPHVDDANKLIRKRRKQLVNYRRHQAGLEKLFRDCAARRVTSLQFYKSLPRFWSWEEETRLQGLGWEIKGKHSNFQQLSASFLRIVDARDADRDDIVAEEIDRLEEIEVPTRAAFLSEMLCLKFPDLYPVKNKPVLQFLADISFAGPRGATEGARYVDLSQRLRMSLKANPQHPAKTLAELDTIIWAAYGVR